MKPLPDFAVLLEPVRAAARAMPREALPALVGALATIQAGLLLPATTAPGVSCQDRTLTPEEVGTRLTRSRDWVYCHRNESPTTRLSSGRWVVSEAKLRRWMDVRSKA